MQAHTYGASVTKVVIGNKSDLVAKRTVETASAQVRGCAVPTAPLTRIEYPRYPRKYV